MIGDLAGFVASIYYRGIPHVQIPTTVVAQVDSAIGGKTGVNAREGKNLIGSFHQPVLVIADPGTLRSLPDREFNEGIAEIIKHAVIRDAAMLDDLAGLVKTSLPALIARNARIKAAIVEEDEFEKLGVRALLNFGHTVGHAIENAGGYGRFLHGEAVSLGIAAALRLSVEKAGLSRAEAEKVLEMLRAFDLPVRIPADIPTRALMEALFKDKKFEAGAIRFVLTGALGSAFVSNRVSRRRYSHGNRRPANLGDLGLAKRLRKKVVNVGSGNAHVSELADRCHRVKGSHGNRRQAHRVRFEQFAADRQEPEASCRSAPRRVPPRCAVEASSPGDAGGS